MRLLVLAVLVICLVLVGCGTTTVVEYVPCPPCPTCPEYTPVSRGEEHYHRAWLVGTSRLLTCQSGGNTTYVTFSSNLLAPDDIWHEISEVAEVVIYDCNFGKQFDGTVYTFGKRQFYFKCEPGLWKR
jgi:hypothetical protein